MNLPHLLCLTSDQINISHSQQVLEFCKAGVRFIQLRCKEISMKEFLKEAEMSVEICQRFEARLIINDSVEVANEVEADGVHLGLNDMHISRARDLLGETKLIGYTIHSYQEITQSIIENANYIGMGPFRESKTKTDHGKQSLTQKPMEVPSKTEDTIYIFFKRSLKQRIPTGE